MHKTLKRILSILFAFMLLPATVLASDTAEDESESFYVLDYFEGTALDLTQYEGKAIYLNFFEEWCQYCMEEMPDIKDIYDLYDPDSLVMILVHPWNGEDADNTASVVSTYGLEGLTTVEDEDMAISNLVGVPGYPTSVFIDQDGYLFYSVASILDYDTFTTVFDAMGVPKRDSEETVVEATPTPSPASSASDAATQATPKN